MFKQLTLLACGLSVLALAGCNNSAQAPPAGESQTTTSSNPNPAPAKSSISIALIPKGTTHIYWKSVEAGGKKAADEAGAKLIFKGPLKESDRAGQIGIVDQFASEGISAIVLAPLDDTALVKPVKSAAGKKIPVVIIDSALNGTPG